MRKLMRLKTVSKIVGVSLLIVGLVLTPYTTIVRANSQVTQISPRVDVIIGFSQTPGSSERALVRAHGGKIKYSYHLVSAIAARIPSQAREALLRNPHITNIDLDGKVYAVDTELDNSWGVKHINSGAVHTDGNKGTGVKVAIIDSGIDYTHPDLDDFYAGGKDFVDGDDDPMDVYGHGTHVAGSACAEDNDNGLEDATGKYGVVGVAPNCALYSLRVLNDSGSGAWSDIIAAMQWTVDNGIQVANLSLGSSSDPGSTVQQAFDNAEAEGVFIVAAAGNSGNPPGKGNSIIYPAKYESVVAVSATDINDQRPSWSSTGEEVELAAPGVSVYSAWNDADSSSDPQPICGNDKNGKYGCYKYGSGTSMASPHVAGVAALVIGAGVTDTSGNGFINDEVRLILNSTAKDIGSPGRDEHYGYGLVDAQAAVSAVGPVDQFPIVAITNPLEGDTVFGTVLITADASDDEGIVSVDFYIDEVFLVQDTTSPYEASWDSTIADEGAHIITATATDTASQTNSDEINVTVDNVNDSPIADAGPDQTVVDSNGDGVEAVTLDGSGSNDPDGTIVSYDWYEGGVLLGSGASLSLDFTVGNHIVTLIVTDNDGATASDEVIIDVVEASDISLTIVGYKVRGLHKADLEWVGGSTTNIDVYRNVDFITTTENDGFYTDNINKRGPATYIYQVCEEGTLNCSNEATIVF